MTTNQPQIGDQIEPVVHTPGKLFRLLVEDHNLDWCRQVVAAGHWVTRQQPPEASPKTAP